MSTDIQWPRRVRQLLSSVSPVVAGTAIALVLVDDTVHAIFDNDRFISVETRIGILALVVGFLVMSVMEVVANLGLLDRTTKSLIHDGSGIGVTAEGESPEQMYASASSIRILNLAGTQFARLGNETNLERIFDWSAGKSVQIMIGDPHGAGIKLRYQPGHGEPATHETGLSGIDRRLTTLYRRFAALPSRARSNFDIRVYPCYPTVSAVQVDDTIYVAFYGFNLRGGDSPMLVTDQGSELGRFVVRHLDSVAAVALSLSDWIATYHPEELQRSG